MNVSLFLHVMGVVVWVGGMFFAYMALRPVAASVLEPPQRLTLWAGVFGKFFPWVWVSVALVLLSGLHMLMVFGGMAAPHYAMAMLALGVLMMLIFAQVFFIPYKKLKRAVDEQNWKAGGAALAQIRMLIGINLSLGLLTIAVVFLGRALAP
ncbi:MAG: CopD family protein [Thiobacillus sp.]|nr:CopD family protein [Thiobacillus sp.]MDP2978749.1 CopD family protein [Thiobacillus sp.]